MSEIPHVLRRGQLVGNLKDGKPRTHGRSNAIIRVFHRPTVARGQTEPFDGPQIGSGMWFARTCFTATDQELEVMVQLRHGEFQLHR